MAFGSSGGVQSPQYRQQNALQVQQDADLANHKANPWGSKDQFAAMDLYNSKDAGIQSGTKIASFLDTLKGAGYGNFVGGSSSDGSGAATGVGGGVGGMPVPQEVAGVAPVDTSAAQAAAFARAKDQVGQTAQGALKGLRSANGATGRMGSGSEGRQVASVVGQGQAQLGDVSRQGAIQESDRAQNEGNINYQGGIAQRGQNVSMRGQDVAANTANNQLTLQKNQMAQQSFQGLLQAMGQSGAMKGLY